MKAHTTQVIGGSKERPLMKLKIRPISHIILKILAKSYNSAKSHFIA